MVVQKKKPSLPLQRAGALSLAGNA